VEKAGKAVVDRVAFPLFQQASLSVFTPLAFLMPQQSKVGPNGERHAVLPYGKL